MSASSAFDLLDERIQRFIWREGWSELREVQEQAIPQILAGNQDVIVSAATAAGKTEAAFFPALTKLLQSDDLGVIVYVSPIKALINDQFGRLDRLCEELEVPVWPWHGDIGAHRKRRFFEAPSGVILITPESLEAMLCRRGTAVKKLFSKTIFFIIDELHAFIGTERGKQLQSLMHRIEVAIDRRICRVALSATLGDMQLAADFLRSSESSSVRLIVAGSSNSELRILIKGFEEAATVATSDSSEAPEGFAPQQIAEYLFSQLRGSNNLVFPNSRREVERYTHLLRRLCQERHTTNEFWPHHGNLSKAIRDETEVALKSIEQFATAICTSTLELGIDIGAVKSVAQIGAPPNVASLRQRMGRSGRRKGEPAVLRGFVIEEEITPQSGFSEQLRLSTVQLAAMTSLLIEGWCEPPSSGLHLSTLIQQLLSLISQNGGLRAGEAFKRLCGDAAPFSNVDASDFRALLHHLSRMEILTQDSSGDLLLGTVGEKHVNHYTFYAAFASDEEFRIISGSTTLGSLPVSQALVEDQFILFSGRTWRVEAISDKDKAIYVVRAKGGTPPMFSGGVGRVHTRVRERMREILSSDANLPYLDAAARRFLRQAREAFLRYQLHKTVFVDLPKQIFVFTWLGDAANEALACLLRYTGIKAFADGVGLEISKAEKVFTTDRIVSSLVSLSRNPPLCAAELLAGASNLEREKWDHLLTTELLQKNYVAGHLDVECALEWVRKNFVTKS